MAAGEQRGGRDLPRAIAGRDELVEAWREVGLPMLTYLAAADWEVPLEPAAAADWLLEGSRVTFLHRFDDVPVIASLHRYRSVNTGRLLVVSPAGAELDAVGTVLDHLARLALHDLGLRRVEWLVPRRWQTAAAAATAIGFAEEACLPEAWFVDGRYEDLVLYGLLAGERMAL